MTREEAIKGLKSLVEVRRKYGVMQTMKDEIECLEMAIKALEQEPRWIPVSEGLSEAGIDVLICDMEGAIYLSHRLSTNSYFDEWGNKIKNIVAWMPLPEPYEPQEGVSE